MNIKPRNTVLNERAKVYKRFYRIEESKSNSYIYKTYDGKFWRFNTLSEEFEIAEPTNTSIVINVNGDYYGIIYYDKSYRYFKPTADQDEIWEVYSGPFSRNYLLSMQFGNTAKYQTNKYLFVGSMDYIIKGSVEGTATQWLKGNEMPLNSFNIQYYDDSLILGKGDLVVIGNRLFEVEDTEAVQKRQPKPYFIYNSTLNNIL